MPKDNETENQEPSKTVDQENTDQDTRGIDWLVEQGLLPSVLVVDNFDKGKSTVIGDFVPGKLTKEEQRTLDATMKEIQALEEEGLENAE